MMVPLGAARESPSQPASPPLLPCPTCQPHPPTQAELFGEVRHKLLPLMVDVFGNYGACRPLCCGWHLPRRCVRSDSLQLVT